MSPIMKNSVDTVNQSNLAKPSPDDVFESIHSIMHRYRALQYRKQSTDAQPLTHMDGKVLAYFSSHAGATQKDLALHSGRDKGQLARLIAGLKERGLIEGQPNEADRRNICLQLTPMGKTVQRALQTQARRVSQRATANLSDDERKQLVALLHKLDAGLRDPD